MVAGSARLKKIHIWLAFVSTKVVISSLDLESEGNGSSDAEAISLAQSTDLLESLQVIMFSIELRVVNLG